MCIRDRFNTVTIKMVESLDVAYNLFQTGELDHVQLTQSTLSTIYDSASHEFHNNLSEARPTKYSYQIHLVYDKNNEDGTKDTNWNTAVANEAFRLSWYMEEEGKWNMLFSFIIGAVAKIFGRQRRSSAFKWQ